MSEVKSYFCSFTQSKRNQCFLHDRFSLSASTSLLPFFGILPYDPILDFTSKQVRCGKRIEFWLDWEVLSCLSCKFVCYFVVPNLIETCNPEQPDLILNGQLIHNRFGLLDQSRDHLNDSSMEWLHLPHDSYCFCMPGPIGPKHPSPPQHPPTQFL